MSLLDEQLEKLRETYPDASMEKRPDGPAVVVVPGIDLPGGWNCSTTTVFFLVPLGFPMAQPDCFWTEDSLRLSNGQIPKNAGVQMPPFGQSQKLWFSWHVANWSQSRDSLKTYLGVIKSRLARPE